MSVKQHFSTSEDASLQDKTTCLVCGQSYRQPRILPCLHTFCSQCILNLQTYPISGENRLAQEDDWSITHGSNQSDDSTPGNSQSDLNIIEPPVGFSSPNVDRATLPRGRCRATGSEKKRLTRSRSCCEQVEVSGKSISHSSRSLTRSETARGISTPRTPHALATPANRKRFILCPICRKEVEVSSSLCQLPRNLIAERHLLFVSQTLPDTALSCGLCNDATNDNIDEKNLDLYKSVTAWCVECAENLCSLCEFAHRRQNRTKAHRLISPESSINFVRDRSSYSTVPEFSQELFTLESRSFSKRSELFKEAPTSSEPSSYQVFEYLLRLSRQEVRTSTDKVSDQQGLSNQGNSSGKRRSGKRPVLACLEHPDQEMMMFCVTCEENVCVDCTFMRHRTHDCQFITKQLFQDQMEDVSKLIQDVTPKVRALDDQLKTLLQTKIAVKERSDEVKDQVNAFMDVFVQSAETHRRNLLTQVTSLTEEKELFVKTAELGLQQTRDDVYRTCQFLADVLTSATDAEVLYLKKVLKDSLTTLGDVPQQPQVTVNGFLRFYPTAKGEIINNFQMFGRVVSHQPSADHSFLHGDGLYTSRVYKKTTMTLSVCGTDGAPFTGSDVTIRSWITYNDQLIKVPVSIVQVADNSHQLEFTSLYKGIHYLHVLLNGAPIKDNPFKFSVKEKWRRHTGSWQCCTGCSESPQKRGSRTWGSGQLDHPDGYYWTCCGKVTYSSCCTGRSSRSATVRKVTV